MRTININGHQIEADDDTIKWLVYGATSETTTDKHEPKAQQRAPEPTEPVKPDKTHKNKKVCVICGGRLPKKHSKYCSHKCFNEYWAKKKYKHKKIKKVCVICAGRLPKKHYRFCSKKCGKQYWRKRHQEKYLAEKGDTQKTQSKIVFLEAQVPKKGNRHCRVCGKKIRGKRTKLCSTECKREAHKKYCERWNAKRKTTKKGDKTPSGVGQSKETGQKKSPLEAPAMSNTKELRRRYIKETADKLCRYNGVSYEKALSMASLQWEAIHLKQEKQSDLNPELRLLKSLVTGEIDAVSGTHLAMIDPDRKWQDFVEWVLFNQHTIKAQLGADGNFVISNGYLRYKR